MNTQTKPLSEINRQATNILYKEMGIVNTIRFLNQFSIGQGNYTKERKEWLNDLDLSDVISQIKSKRESD